MLLVYINAPTRESALQIGRELVASRLAAAVNLFAVESIYRWEETVHEGAEWTLAAKTTSECFDALVASVKKQHPYSVPAIQAVEVPRVSRDYADWVAASTVAPAWIFD